MKSKMTISELRTFIQEQALNLLADHLIEERRHQQEIMTNPKQPSLFESALKAELEKDKNL